VLPGSSPLDALIHARRSLVDLATLCAGVVLVHVWASWHYEWRKASAQSAADGERFSVPRAEARRLKKYLLFAAGVAAGAAVLKAAFVAAGCGIWTGACVLAWTGRWR
jgi:hypothetical protein